MFGSKPKRTLKTKSTGQRQSPSSIGPRKTKKQSKADKLKVRSHHRHAPNRPKIEPAPECLPEGARIPISVQIPRWRNPLSCNLVRVDEETRQVLLALPDDARPTHLADRGEPALIGWPGHDSWHESKSSVATKMQRNSKYFWVRLTAMPVHHERRRFVRANHVRPISIHSGRDIVKATTMDVSEAALRVVAHANDPIHSGDKVHLMFSTLNRHRGDRISIAIDGHVYRTRELGTGAGSRKEIVIFFENLTPSHQDFIRGLVFDIDLQEKRPQNAE